MVALAIITIIETLVILYLLCVVLATRQAIEDFINNN